MHGRCFFNIKDNTVFGSKEAVESESTLSSTREDLRKKRAVFPSNLLHHIPKIQWIKPYAPKLTITAEATGAWNISYHLRPISTIHATLSYLGSFLRRQQSLKSEEVFGFEAKIIFLF